jgi:hypothetical protein
MSDIRTRLAVAIHKARLAQVLTSEELADQLLSLPGIAIVELPEPDSDREDEDDPDSEQRLGWAALDTAYFITQWGYPDEVQIAYDCEPMEPLTVAEARSLAAALLAAANIAEQPVAVDQ